MEEKDVRIKNHKSKFIFYSDSFSKKDIFDDSHISAISELTKKKNDNFPKENRGLCDSKTIEKSNQSNKQRLIEDETKNYVDELKKGSYNILVLIYNSIFFHFIKIFFLKFI